MQDPLADTRQRLVDAFETLSPQLRTAAQYLIAHPEEVGLNSMRSVAKAAGVKPATVSRLSKALGYRDYQALREPFRQRLRSGSTSYAELAHDVQARGDREGTRGLFQAVRNGDLENVQAALADDQYAALSRSVELLGESRRVFVLGLRGAYSAAFLFHYAYQFFRGNCQLVDTGAGIFADQLRDISGEDCLIAISFPPYTQLTIDIVDYAAAAGARIVSITDSDLSPLARSRELTITTPYTSPSFFQSFIGAVAVVEALITLLVSTLGDEALATVENSERQLQRMDAYWHGDSPR